MEAGGNVDEAKKGGAGSGGGNDQDLSMEEILQSIRRIIAEDDKQDGTAEGAAAKTAADEKKKGGKEGVPGSDVLELTEMVKEDTAPAEAKKVEKTEKAADAPKKEAANNDVLAKINEALSEQDKDKDKDGGTEAEESASAEAATPAEKPAPAAPAGDQVERAKKLDSMLSDEAASAAAAQFKRLHTDDMPEDVSVPSPPFRSGTTVEDLVTEMLRPMMKEWLDGNLPQIVERIVEREVKKLTR